VAVPDAQRHRGAHPEDQARFAPSALPSLRAAVAEFSWLLTRGYAERSGLKLVGDRHALDQRQRAAVSRCSCADDQLQRRRTRQLPAEAARGRTLAVDGFNLLTTVEAALGGAVVLRGRDRCLRDLLGIHGSYRRVAETGPALAAVGAACAALEVARLEWLLDQPVSNSGRLATLLRDTAERHAWPWQVELCPSPDRRLKASTQVVVTADSAILDRCGAWFDLASDVIGRHVPAAWLLELG
jgi:hypothetical protein